MAINDFMCDISNAQPLEPEVVDELLGAGYDSNTVEAWERSICRSRLPMLRHDGHEAVRLLDIYAGWGVSGPVACAFIALGLDSASAGLVDEAGLAPEDAQPYVDRLGDFYEDYYGETLVIAFANNGAAIADWVVSEFDVDQACMYTKAGLTTGEARTWHPVVEAHGLTMDDLGAVRRVGWSPSEAFRLAVEYGKDGPSIGDAARTMLALA
jgi:hypothetical protein